MIKRLLLRLYPRAWRDRYGVELRALLEETPARSGDTWDLLRSALAMRLAEPLRTLAITLIGVAACNGAMFAWHALTALPVSQATLSGPVTMSNQDVNVGGQQVLSRRAVRELILRHNLRQDDQTMEDAVESVRRRTSISAITNRDLAVGFEHSDPAKAQAVASDLALAFANHVEGLQVTRAPELGRQRSVFQIWITAASLLGLVAGVLFARWTRRAHSARLAS